MAELVAADDPAEINPFSDTARLVGAIEALSAIVAWLLSDMNCDRKALSTLHEFLVQRTCASIEERFDGTEPSGFKEWIRQMATASESRFDSVFIMAEAFRKARNS